MNSEIIRVAKAQTKDICNNPFQIAVSFVGGIDESIVNNCSFFSKEMFASYIEYEKPQNIVLSCSTQEQLDLLLEIVKDNVLSLDLRLKRTADFNLSKLSELQNLTSIQFYANSKISKLWNIRDNTKLKHFEMINYNSISDFNDFEYSAVEDFTLLGCNGLSSFSSKLHVNGLEFLSAMPLKSLRLDIVKDKPDAYYLNIFSQLTSLECLYLPDSFFTFRQFAWLSAKLPNVKRGLEACAYIDYLDCYSVIGRRKPRNLKNTHSVDMYVKEYEDLKSEYRYRKLPPDANDD